ncbi:exosortase A [Erythrobacter lutimaris]|nr:exosortase A [Alteriqipengyuania lutimaris]
MAQVLGGLPAAWPRALGWLAFAWGSALLLTMPQWVDMARQWFTVSTYQHILFVPPIIGWLVWNRREALAGIAPQAWLPGLGMVAGALFVWLVGTLTSLDLLAQAGAVLVLQCAVLAVLGLRAGAVLAFPLAFAAFLVPFGEEIVTPLQMLTAEMVIALTHLSGIPAQIDGIFIDTPAGLFEVAEACAGVQFVVAMLTLGVLAAKVGMTRWPHRIALLALCLVVPILANGVRAWGTIAIAQYVGAERAGGIDHIVYGWVFFALVVALVMALAWRWFDRDPEAEGRCAGRWVDHRLVLAIDRPHLRASTLVPVLVALIALAGLWSGLARSGTYDRAALAGPDVPGWTLVETQMRTNWQPLGAAASERLHLIYRDPEGQSVDLYLAAYDGDADPTASAEGAVPQNTPWRRVRAVSAAEGMMGEELVRSATEHRMAWTSYVAGGQSTANTLAFRLIDLGDRLALRAEPRWLVILSTADGASEEQAEGLLRRFHARSGGPAALVEAATAR